MIMIGLKVTTTGLARPWLIVDFFPFRPDFPNGPAAAGWSWFFGLGFPAVTDRLSKYPD
jgi:hypothetical protein